MTRYINADETLNNIIERHCKECVSRKGMKNGKLRVLYEIGDAPCRACLIDDMKTMIDDAPAVDAEIVKNGHWKVHERAYLENNAFYRDLYECSICGVMNNEDTHYCPWCGAKMEDEEK